MAELTGLERIKRQIIQMQKDEPFFACMSLYLNFIEIDKKTEKMMGGYTMGVNMKGDVHYSKEWVDGLTEEELRGVIVHELSHIMFAHMLRQGERDKELFNIASDICVNSLLMDNNFQLPKGVLVVNREHKIELPTIKGKILIEKTDEKTAEEIYKEIERQIPKINIGKFLSKSGLDKAGFDKHIEEVAGKKLSKEEKDDIRKEWQDRIEQVYIQSKIAGKVPAGIERLVGKLRENKINWKVLLRMFIKKQMSGTENNWKKPNKKFRVFGYHFPTTRAYGVDVCCVIDLSGSISEKDLNDFVSEIVGIAKQYRNKINLRIVTHETDITDDYEIKRANKEKILRELKLKGGGGTSHKEVWELIKKDSRDMSNRAIILLTDGYSDIEKKDNPKLPVLWVVSENGTESKNFPFGKVIRLED